MKALRFLLAIAASIGAAQSTPGFKCVGESARFPIRGWWQQPGLPWDVNAAGDTLAWFNATHSNNNTMNLCAGKVSSVLAASPEFACTEPIFAFGDYSFIFIQTKLVYSHDSQFFALGNCLVDLRQGTGNGPLPHRCLGPKTPVTANVRTIISKFAEDASGNPVFIVPVNKKIYTIKASDAFTEGVPAVVTPSADQQPYQVGVSGSDVYWLSSSHLDTYVCSSPLSSLVEGSDGDVSCTSPLGYHIDFSNPTSTYRFPVSYKGLICLVDPSWLLKWQEGPPTICSTKEEAHEQSGVIQYDPEAKLIAWRRVEGAGAVRNQSACYATVTQEGLANTHCLLGGTQQWWSDVQNQGGLVGMDYGDIVGGAPTQSAWLVVDASTGSYSNGTLDSKKPYPGWFQFGGSRISAQKTWFAIVADVSDWWFCQGPAVE